MKVQCPICRDWKEDSEFVHDEDNYIERDCIACRDAWYYQTKKRADELAAERMGVGFF
jgi:hypothetical protein